MAFHRLRAVLAAALLCGMSDYGLCGGTAYDAGVESVEVMRSGTDVLGRTIVYPRTDRPEVAGLRVRIPAGQETGWHTHSAPGYAYILSGTLTLRYADGTERSFGPGDAFSEVVGVAHNGRNAGAEDAVLVVFFTGEAGVPVTQSVPAPETAGER